MTKNEFCDMAKKERNLSELALLPLLDADGSSEKYKDCVKKQRGQVTNLQKIFWPLRNDGGDFSNWVCVNTDDVWKSVCSQLEQNTEDSIVVDPYADLNACAHARASHVFVPKTPSKIFHNPLQISLPLLPRKPATTTYVTFLDYCRIVVWKTQRIALLRYKKSLVNDPLARCILERERERSDNLIPARETYDFRMSNLQDDGSPWTASRLSSAHVWVTNWARYFQKSALCQLYDMLNGLQKLLNQEHLKGVRNDNQELMGWLHTMKFFLGMRSNSKEGRFSQLFWSWINSNPITSSPYAKYIFLATIVALVVTASGGVWSAVGMASWLVEILKWWVITVGTLVSSWQLWATAVIGLGVGKIAGSTKKLDKLFEYMREGTVLDDIWGWLENQKRMGRFGEAMRKMAMDFVEKMRKGLFGKSKRRREKPTILTLSARQWSNLIQTQMPNHCHRELIVRLYAHHRTKEIQQETVVVTVDISKIIGGHYGVIQAFSDPITEKISDKLSLDWGGETTEGKVDETVLANLQHLGFEESS